MKALVFLCFTAGSAVGCGGAPFVAGDLAGDPVEADAGEITSADSAVKPGEDAGGELDSAAEAGESDAPTDKGSTDGGIEADSSAPPPEKDAAPVCADPGVAWTCTESDEFVAVASGQYCIATYSNPAISAQLSTFIAVAAPAQCACDDACACIEAATPCGNDAFMGCTEVSGGGALVTCNGAARP